MGGIAARVLIGLSALAGALGASRLLLAEGPSLQESPAISRPFEDAHHRGGPPSIPGIVYAALYDLGGEGVAYHDTTVLNEGSNGLNREPAHQRVHGSPYIWHFRANESVDVSFVKDWADLNHPNLADPPINAFYLGWTADGEWTRYTVNVTEPGTYLVSAIYAFRTTTVSFDVDGQPASTLKVPVATESYHHWNLAPLGTIKFATAGRHVLTFHYGAGNNWLFFLFEKVTAR